MTKKIVKERNLFLVMIMFVVVTCISFIYSNVQAVENDINNETVVNISEERVENVGGIFDTKAIDGIYKASDEKFGYLPFIRYALDRIIVDKEISGLGTLFSATNIEVNSPMTGLQVLFANDTVRVNSNMEYGIIFAANNTVIEGTIDKPLIIFSGKDITISENAVLNSDLICYSNSLKILGKIKGSVLGASTNIKVDGNVEKDLRVQSTNIDIKDDKCILGNVYVETYNKNLNISQMYPSAFIKVLETQTNKFSYNVVMNAIITCLLFTLIYVVVNRKTKGKIYEQVSIRIKENILFLILSGSILLLAMPAVVVLLILLSIFGLHSIAIPALLIYVVGIIVISLLSTLIVGSLLATYMSKYYFKDKSAMLNTIGTFFVFLSLNILTKLQYVGSYVTMALILLSVGIIMTYIFKKNNKIVNKEEK